MGVKKIVRVTVEAEIEIELPDWTENPSQEDIDGVNACGFHVENSDDIFKEAARLILRGYTGCNNDVFGAFHDFWKKRTIENPESKSFYDLNSLDIKDFSVKAANEKTND